ncbi:hypothetical protein H2199_007106 [Coniosporium tulheliwenetii]|uniref:Uncharacterized protein n=1 Tax=Coniosporium tulheliwenetii TaxID=3383036 RepID=A0ACC2YTN9_9PEZI|nr:hypothetical protein H2199_007106 [Cladosporium sp. JES 115]
MASGTEDEFDPLADPEERRVIYSVLDSFALSAEGKAERAACYDPVLEALRAEFSHIPDPDKGELHVLVPGAGLGRLVMGICCVGFSVEGNEISYHQLMASNMILNDITRAEQYPLYPWALSSSNHVSRADQLQGVMIPDVHPAAALEEASIGKRMHASERMSMSAGDFCVVYKNAENSGVYNAVTTVFFIDTAPNLIAYIETIRNSNGRAQDQGIAEPGSMELTDDEVVALVERFGFKIEKHEVGKIATGYIQDPRSMLMNIYRPSFWVARKQ